MRTPGRRAVTIHGAAGGQPEGRSAISLDGAGGGPGARPALTEMKQQAFPFWTRPSLSLSVAGAGLLATAVVPLVGRGRAAQPSSLATQVVQAVQVPKPPDAETEAALKRAREFRAAQRQVRFT